MASVEGIATLTGEAPAKDTLGFFLFLAFALHLMLILGVGFSQEWEPAVSPQLEVTLAHHSSMKAPEQARFIAQENQEGSGDAAELAELTTRELADFSDDTINETGAAPTFAQPRQDQEQQALVTTLDDALNQISLKPEPKPDPLPAPAINPEVSRINDNIASLQARLDEQEQAYAERPRVKRLTSLAARRAVDAAYLYAWRTRVESIGNRYYPEASSRNGIYGDLRLMVAIRHDGSIDNIEILSSSGHAVLDEAAIRIVRMAAPYEPFPAELRATTDKLEIIRTWKFRQNRLSSVQG